MPLLSLRQKRSWEVGIAGGAVHDIRTPLLMQQANAEAVPLKATYQTEPFTPPVIMTCGYVLGNSSRVGS